MTFKNMTFELTPEQIEQRNILGNKLLELEAVQLFMKHYNCPKEVVVENAYMFKRWLKGIHDVKNVPLNEIQEDLSKGQYLDLIYDDQSGILSEVVASIGVVSEIKKERQYLNQYKIFSLALNLRNAHFENLSYEGESAVFLKTASLLQDFLNDDETGYYLYGDLGVGKSYLSACVSNGFAKDNYPVVYAHVPTLLNTLKQSFGSSFELENTMERLKKVKLLVLDDLGAEPITLWGRDEILLTILNDRLENKRKTLITGNYNPEMLVDLYKLDSKGRADEIRARRLVDRILALAKPIELAGKNRRNV